MKETKRSSQNQFMMIMQKKRMLKFYPLKGESLVVPRVMTTSFEE